MPCIFVIKSQVHRSWCRFASYKFHIHQPLGRPRGESGAKVELNPDSKRHSLVTFHAPTSSRISQTTLHHVRSRHPSTFDLPAYPPRAARPFTLTASESITDAKTHPRRLHHQHEIAISPAPELQASGEKNRRSGTIPQVPGWSAHVHHPGGEIQPGNEHDG